MTAPAPDPWHAYDYAVVRVVPRVHTGTFADVGVVLHARTAGFLDLRLLRDAEHLTACCRGAVSLDALRRHLDAYERVCHGDDATDPLCVLPPSERFHWLTAPRSTVLQTSELHPGRTRDPAACLDHLFQRLVAA